MERRYDVLAVGDVNVDLILSGLARMPEWGTEVLAGGMGLRLGGSTANLACACAALGLRTALVAWVGTDAFGDFLVDELRSHGVDDAYLRRTDAPPTGITVSLSGPEDRAFVTALGTIDFLRAEDVPHDAVGAARHLHAGSLFLQSTLRPGLPHLFDRAHAAGATVSFDTGYDPAEAWDDDVWDCIERADLFLPNEVEATAITHTDDPAEAAASLATAGPLVAVKLGRDGACAHADGRLIRAPGFPVQVADTTACGDAFNAGFLLGWLGKRPVAECLRLGNAAGALMVTASGNDPSVLSAERVQTMAKGA